MEAAANGHGEIASLLITAGADTNLQEKVTNIFSKISSCLLLACFVMSDIL